MPTLQDAINALTALLTRREQAIQKERLNLILLETTDVSIFQGLDITYLEVYPSWCEMQITGDRGVIHKLQAHYGVLLKRQIDEYSGDVYFEEWVNHHGLRMRIRVNGLFAVAAGCRIESEEVLVKRYRVVCPDGKQKELPLEPGA